jgi:hypothetical protein
MPVPPGRVRAPSRSALAWRKVPRSSRRIRIAFHHFTGATGQFYLPEIMGSGVALVDYDGDGDLDVFLLQGIVLEPGKTVSDARFPPPAGWKPGNRLFRNMLKETGRLHFVDVTEEAGLNRVAFGMGVAVGDYNNDGYPDLYVTNFGANVLYRNTGNGKFVDETSHAGVEAGGWSTSAHIRGLRQGRLPRSVCGPLPRLHCSRK